MLLERAMLSGESTRTSVAGGGEKSIPLKCPPKRIIYTSPGEIALLFKNSNINFTSG